jgi:hypothetical protein
VSRFLGMCTHCSVKAGVCPTESGRSLRGIVKRYSKDGGVGRDAFNQRVPSARNVKLLPEIH